MRELGGLAVTSGWTVKNRFLDNLLESKEDERPNQRGGCAYSCIVTVGLYSKSMLR